MYSQKKVLRVIDVNFNRCKEGLRVVEDIFRFVLEDDNLRRQIRKIRHAIDRIMKSTKLKETLISSRDATTDLGRAVDSLEMKRSTITHLFYANVQRVKESLRVLEEFMKVVNIDKVKIIKRSRYEIYQIEKDALKKWAPLRNFR